MKTYLLTALLALFYLCTPFAPVKASADVYGSYAYIPDDSVYFYSDEPDESKRTGLFRLPYTYYVRLVSEEKDYYRVEYLTDGATTRKLVGYCKKSEVVPVDYIPELPYLYLTLDVTYVLDGNAKDDGFSEITVTCAYYGDYTDGTRVYSYVLRGEKFGYILKPSNLAYDLNDEYERKTQTSAPPSSSPSKTGKKTHTRTVLLILLCLLVPALAALILRQPGKPPYETDE